MRMLLTFLLFTLCACAGPPESGAVFDAGASLDDDQAISPGAPSECGGPAQLWRIRFLGPTCDMEGVDDYGQVHRISCGMTGEGADAVSTGCVWTQNGRILAECGPEHADWSNACADATPTCAHWNSCIAYGYARIVDP